MNGSWVSRTGKPCRVAIAALALTIIVGGAIPDVAAARGNRIIQSQEDFDRLHAELGDNVSEAAQKYCKRLSRYKICIRTFSLEYARFRRD
jgi:hypothetical protein